MTASPSPWEICAQRGLIPCITGFSIGPERSPPKWKISVYRDAFLPMQPGVYVSRFAPAGGVEAALRDAVQAACELQDAALREGPQQAQASAEDMGLF